MNQTWAVITSLLNAVMLKWTPEQAQAIFLWLQSFSQEEIAGKLGIRQPAVQQRLRLAGHSAMGSMLTGFKNDFDKYKAVEI